LEPLLHQVKNKQEKGKSMKGVGAMVRGQQKIGQFQTFAFLLLPFVFPHCMGRDNGGDD
jgi:hypothetical protein